MKKNRKIAAVACVLFLGGSLFAKEIISKEAKEMINLLVRIDRMDTEYCLYLNPKKKNIYATEIWYMNQKEGRVNYDGWDGLAQSVLYSQSDGLLDSSQWIDIYESETKTGNNHKVVVSKNQLSLTNGYSYNDVIENFEYEITGNGLHLVSEDAKYGGYEIEKTENGYDVYKSNDGKRKKALSVQTGKSLTLVKSPYGESYWKYKGGILIERYVNNTTYRYSVTSGSGVLQEKEKGGDFRTVASLERKTDKDGYLLYEKIEYLDGHATEIFIGDSLPDVSRLVNK